LSKRGNLELGSVSRILVPIDGSQNATRALYLGISLARTFGAELVVLNVIPTPNVLITTSAFGAPASGVESYYEQQENASSRFLEEAKADAKKHGLDRIATEVVRADKSVVEEIIEAANHHKVDLIVVGTRGLGGFKKLLQGSVSSGVVTHAHCNVLVVR
jgi:nucleotide-binding universal stress UspA family protein